MLCRVDPRRLVRLSGGRSPAWEAVELTLGDRLYLPVRGPRPYRFVSDIAVAPGQMPVGFLPAPDADCLPFLVKLVQCTTSLLPHDPTQLCVAQGATRLRTHTHM